LTDRLADAHAVLAPALKGFAPMPEMPELREAQALLAALAECDEAGPPKNNLRCTKARSVSLNDDFATSSEPSEEWAATSIAVAARRACSIDVFISSD
jgi:hypothetical protein